MQGEINETMGLVALLPVIAVLVLGFKFVALPLIRGLARSVKQLCRRKVDA